MIILGLDPGLATTGWGVIRAEGNRLSHIANGHLKTDNKEALARRLSHLDSMISPAYCPVSRSSGPMRRTRWPWRSATRTIWRAHAAFPDFAFLRCCVLVMSHNDRWGLRRSLSLHSQRQRDADLRFV
jgi:hypothetical protein